MKPTIASAGNTLVPAILVLRDRGFIVSRSISSDDKELWLAENDVVKLVAEDPLLLLGLAMLHEVKGSNWKASGSEIDEFLKEFPQE